MTDRKTIIDTGWRLDNSYTHLPKVFFNSQNPTPVKSPKLVKLNYSLAEELGLNKEFLKSSEGIDIFAGNKLPKDSTPIAQAYGGHQFGHFTMLGDGRAVLIGEQITPTGERFDIQLKGSGRTPYSRGGDGRAALGPMLREYIISEAMYSLGIPTTRSLAVVTTGESIIRDTKQPGAVMTRIASSHIRVGTFEYIARRGDIDDLRALADYTLKRHFPSYNTEENPYIYLLQEVIKRQASLITKWQLIGFIHGVMNTDNMAVSGETIDYGPCAFMDSYDASTVFSSIDTYGRYAYGNQPAIAQWNLARFAETLIPLLDEDQDTAVSIASNVVSGFSKIYNNNFISGMRKKLGIFNEEDDDESLIEEILNIMQKYKVDFTNTFCDLTFDKIKDTDFYNSEEFTNWYKLWQSRLDRQTETKEESHNLMKNSNPAVIPRNHRVEEALEAALREDYSVMDNLLKVLANPYEYSKEQEEYSKLSKSCGTYRTFCGT